MMCYTLKFGLELGFSKYVLMTRYTIESGYVHVCSDYNLYSVEQWTYYGLGINRVMV